MKNDNFGFVRVAAGCPKLAVASPMYNIAEIEELIKEADQNDSSLIVLPELCITGYTCGDLFGQRNLINKAEEALLELLNNTKDCEVVAVVGMPVFVFDRLYNCGIAIQSGKILGIVPKMFMPNYKEFYEKRWFTSGYKISSEISQIKFLGQTVPFGNIVFKSDDFSFGIEVCEDLWGPIPPSSYLVVNGAHIILNLSASNDRVGKSSYRKQLVGQQSARGICGYLYCSSGVYESTTDIVFGGDCIIAENGAILNQSERFSRENTITYAEIDIEKLSHERQANSSFSDSFEYLNSENNYRIVDFSNIKTFNVDKYTVKVSSTPFIPNDDAQLNERCEEIFNIQTAGLAKRLEHTKIKNAVIGISGGLDSTLALLVTVKTFDILKIPRENICGITMPGFGTSDETYNNAVGLMKSLGITIKEIDIKPSCLQHFQDIEHNPEIHDITYENVQARERTQILMDYANKINGLVVGTGDLSELALGWCTYNGDHMSMYAVNCSIPKTLVKFLVNWVAENKVNELTKEILKRILNLPISPELLPPDESGKIKQKTEDLVGPYELHDFFMFYTLRYGMSPKKVLFLAKNAFENKYSEQEIKKWIKVFYKRFFSQQFKRSCMPDGPKVGSVSLSPRGDWRMPSDADASVWLGEI